MLKKVLAIEGVKVLTNDEQSQVGRVSAVRFSFFGFCPPQTCSVRNVCVYC